MQYFNTARINNKSQACYIRLNCFDISDCHRRPCRSHQCAQNYSLSYCEQSNESNLLSIRWPHSVCYYDRWKVKNNEWCLQDRPMMLKMSLMSEICTKSCSGLTAEAETTLYGAGNGWSRKTLTTTVADWDDGLFSAETRLNSCFQLPGCMSTQAVWSPNSRVVNHRTKVLLWTLQREPVSPCNTIF